MTYALCEQRGRVGLITLNRPERLNAISGALMRDFHAALVKVQTNPDISVILLSGNGRAFCAGDDLKEFGDQTRSDQAVADHIGAIQTITRDLMFSDRIVVGAVHGFAVGGGFEWLLNCDLVVAAEDLVAFFPEMDWGQFVTGAVTYLLPQAVGYQQAMELMLLGERKSAADLQRLGLVNRVVPREAMFSTAFELAQRIADKSAASTSALKHLINRRLSNVEAALKLEEEETILAFKRPDAAVRVQAFVNRKKS